MNDIINPLLTSCARSVRESIAFGYEEPQATLSPTNLALSKTLILAIHDQIISAAFNTDSYLRETYHSHYSAGKRNINSNWSLYSM